ncbi:MAG: zinc ribbon domain-containing protein [Candidatus Korarchaeota archaeon]
MERESYFRKCPYCGAENELDALVCVNCKRELPATVVRIVRKKKETLIPHSPIQRLILAFIKPHKIFPEIWEAPENAGPILTAVFMLVFYFGAHALAISRFYQDEAFRIALITSFIFDSILVLVLHILRFMLAAAIICAPLKIIGSKNTRPYQHYAAIVGYSYVFLLVLAIGYFISAAILPAHTYEELLTSLQLLTNKTAYIIIMCVVAPMFMGLGVKIRETNRTIDILTVIYLYGMSATWGLVYMFIPFV